MIRCKFPLIHEGTRQFSLYALSKNFMIKSLRAYRSDDCEALATIFAASIDAIDETVYSAAQKQAWRQVVSNPAAEIIFWKNRFATSRPWVAVNEQDRPIGFIEVLYNRDDIIPMISATLVNSQSQSIHQDYAEALAYIDMLYVHPNYQRQGVARALYKYSVAQCLALGTKAVWVHASTLARPFFAQHGFIDIEYERVKRHGVGLERYLMKKSL